MKSFRMSLVFTSLSAFLLASCLDSGGPDAGDALKSTAPAVEAPKKVTVKSGQRLKTFNGQVPSEN